MAAASTTASQTSDLGWLKIVGKVFYFLFILIVAFIIYKSSWYWGTTWLLLGAFIYIRFMLKPDYRRFGLFAWVNLAIVAYVSAILQTLLMRNSTMARLIERNGLLNFLLEGYGATVFWSIVLGLIVALTITCVPLIIIAWVGSVYVLALHKMDGVSQWDAIKYIVTLILGINLPYITVENGQAIITKDAAKLNVIGGPGHLVVKQGNVVVLERGGKITRIVNAGVTNLKPMETIRNIFPLNVQSNPPPDTPPIEHVLTKDRIPLKIVMKIAFQIEPAAEVDKRDESRIAPHGEALTKKLDDGLYQVYEGTIRKAALMSQATSFAKREIEKCKKDAKEEKICHDIEETDWKKIAGGVPEGELRDYIMSHNFDELFELMDNADGDKPGIRVSKRKLYEIEEAILKQIRPAKVTALGVFVRSVDIGRIEFHGWAESLMLGHWGEKVKLEGGVRFAEFMAQAKVINARAAAQARILEGQGEGEARAAFVREALEEVRRFVPISNEEVVRFVLPELIKAMTYMDDWRFTTEGGSRRRPFSRRRRSRGDGWREGTRASLPAPKPEANGTSAKADKPESGKRG